MNELERVKLELAKPQREQEASVVMCEECERLQAEVRYLRAKLEATEKASKAYYEHVQTLLRKIKPEHEVVMERDVFEELQTG